MITIQAPYKYLQGPDLMNEFGQHVSHIGKKFLILGSKTIIKKKQEAIEKSFKNENLECEFIQFNGEVTKEEYNRIAEKAKEGSFESIVGLGGGKVIDTAKAAANVVDLPFISAPSTASNDAPCSSLSVIYNDDGHVVDVEFYKHNPALVIVDSEVISDAPPETLISGMGDALATYFEARVCYEHGFLNALGSSISNTAIAIGQLSYTLLQENSYLALRSLDVGVVSQPLENVIEANTFLSGLGFESGGLSCAHSIQDALTTIPECHDNTMHGDRVAFGTICLLILENSWDEVDDVINYCMEVGLPITLKQLHITEDVEKKIADILPTAMAEDMPVYNMPPGTTREKMYSAILLADKLGKEALG